MKTFTLIIAILCLFSIQSWGQKRYSLPENITKDDYIKGKIIFKFLLSEKDNFSDKKFQQVLHRINVTDIKQKFPNSPIPREKYNEYGMPLVDISLIYELTYQGETKIENAINLLLDCDIFEYAVPHILPQVFYTPNDPGITNQYTLLNINAYAAWNIHKGDTNHVVGITDTGCEFAHPDLFDAIKYNYNDPLDAIVVSDGFTTLEKYTMLTTNRGVTGNGVNGNDITSLMSSGPYTLAPADTVEVSFAVILENTYLEVLEGAENAQLHFSDTSSSMHNFNADHLFLYPNPASDFVQIKSNKNLHIVNISIFNSNEMLVKTVNGIGIKENINISALPAGLYIFKIQTENKVIS